MTSNHMSESQTKALELEVRHKLYSAIVRYPGLHYREIQRRTGIATGQLTYHLEYLREVHLVKTANDGEYLRYYSNTQISPEERKVLELARQKSVRHILLHLLDNDGCDHNSVVNSLGLSPSTVSWHLKKLLDAGVISKRTEGRRSIFSIVQPELVVVVLMKYKESFLDRLVDQFIDMWDA
jgi:predicted transcriptional regulator